MDKTANLKLNKPKMTDFVSETVEKVFGENCDIIDDVISDITTGLEGKADSSHTHSDLAPKASPDFTGTPTAPTASKGTSTTQLATTKFVQDAIDGIVIPEDTSALAHSHPNKTVLDGISADDVSGWRGHLLNTSNPHNVKFSQTVQRLGSNADLDDIDDGFYIATDRVDSLPAFSNVDSPGVVLQTSHGNAKIQVAFAMSEQYWRIYRRRYSNNVWTAWEHQNASPVFTGTPVAPTAASGTNTQQIATTAFVAAAIAAINITKEAVGLGNVPNVATNDQTPTYTAAADLATLVSGEKLSVSMGKTMLAITNLISHLANASNPHSVTASQVGAAAASHKHGAGDITSGTLPVTRGGTGITNLTNSDYTTSRMRGISLQTTVPDLIPNGHIVGVYAI